jgi:hypothetical protein
MVTDVGTQTNPAPNWSHVGAFIGLNFGLTWLLNLAIYLGGGLKIPGIVPILQLQMVLPAFSAILLGLFFFRESPIYRGRPAGRGRWFYYYFLLLTLIYVLAALGAWLAPAQGGNNAAGCSAPLCSLHLGSAVAHRTPHNGGSRGNGPGLAVGRQLALLTGLWPGVRRLLRPAGGPQRHLRPRWEPSGGAPHSIGPQS